MTKMGLKTEITCPITRHIIMSIIDKSYEDLVVMLISELASSEILIFQLVVLYR